MEHDGYTRAGYFAPDCEQFRENAARGEPVKYSGYSEGWRRVGFSDATCERLTSTTS